MLTVTETLADPKGRESFLKAITDKGVLAACDALGLNRASVYRYAASHSNFGDLLWAACRENEKGEISKLEQLLAERGSTSRKRRDLRLRIYVRQKTLGLKKRLDAPPDVINKKKARRLKAIAKKLNWLARQDFNIMTPEARRAAKKLLLSDLAGQLLSVTPRVTE